MILKYIFDRVMAFVGLAFLWPIIAIVAILIKIKEPTEPVVFVQKRVGQNGKLFNCHKFRTMTIDNDSYSVTIYNDSRITPLGATLRHYKLDELLGLWDVLIGKMSFVGPRPDVPGYADLLTGSDRNILKLRPGITGPATLKYRAEDEMLTLFVSDFKKLPHSKITQKYTIKNLPADKYQKLINSSDQEIAVWYNDNVIYPDKVRINLYYYNHYSFITDIKIIGATILRRKINYNGEII